MRRVRSRGIVLERLVVRDVIGLERLGYCGSRLATAPGGSVGIHDAEVESTFEETPGDARGVQQVPDVLPGHLKRLACSGGANIAAGIGVADIREPAVSVVHQRARSVQVVSSAVGLARNQINGARS